MKKSIYTVIAVLALSFSACEKVVDLDLNSIEPRLVIDASISDGEECKVVLSMTKNYYDNSELDYVSGAQVFISVNGGNEEQLVEAPPGGFYFSSTRGITNETYTVRVVVDGKEYKSTATIPPTVPIDRLFIYNIQLDDKYWFSPCVAFHDPGGIANYYLYTIYVNDRRMKSIYVDDDIYNDGLYHERILPFDDTDNNEEELVYGDNVRVVMESLDIGAFTFYQTLFSVASGGGTNPIGNFTGGVLGCFKAYGASPYEIIISEDNVFTREL